MVNNWAFLQTCMVIGRPLIEEPSVRSAALRLAAEDVLFFCDCMAARTGAALRRMRARCAGRDQHLPRRRYHVAGIPEAASHHLDGASTGWRPIFVAAARDRGHQGAQCESARKQASGPRSDCFAGAVALISSAGALDCFRWILACCKAPFSSPLESYASRRTAELRRAAQLQIFRKRVQKMSRRGHLGR